MAATLLELLSQQVVNPGTGKASPYFEDAWYQLIQALGGEGSTAIDDGSEGAELARRIPHILGNVHRLRDRVEELEGDLTSARNSHSIAQLQVDTAGYVADTKNVPYTLKHNDWIEASKGAPITIPLNALKNHRFRLSIADSSGIKLNSASSNIKIRGALTNSVFFRTAGESFDFHYFGDYWLAA